MPGMRVSNIPLETLIELIIAFLYASSRLLTTNAVSLNDKNVDLMERYLDHLFAISISIIGSTQEEVKKYMGGGSVHKNKNKMLTTKGWGASRKT